MIVGGWFADPPPEARLKRIWEGPGVRSCQTTLILPFLSTATCSASDKPASLERFCGVGENVVPPSTERAKKMSPLPTVVSSQATLILPLESTANRALDEPGLLETFFGVGKKVAPPSVEREKKMSGLTLGGVFSSQDTFILPPASSASCGPLALPGMLERFLGIGEKVAPPSTERLKKMVKLPVLVLLFCQTTLILPPGSTAI